jgi:hypothetical protein
LPECSNLYVTYSSKSAYSVNKFYPEKTNILNIPTNISYTATFIHSLNFISYDDLILVRMYY